MDLTAQIHDFGRRARAAARVLRQCASEQKNRGLLAMADQLVAMQDEILAANRIDVEKAKADGLTCEMDQYLDCIVPRGGKGLIETVVSHARMPVIKHYDGICIMHVDKDADLAMADSIVLNAKVQRPGVCNAIETVLVHRDIAEKF